MSSTPYQTTDTVGINVGGATTDLIGLYGVTPIAQRAGAAQAALTATGVTSSGTTTYGFSTEAGAIAAIALLAEIRAALVAIGAIKGAA